MRNWIIGGGVLGALAAALVVGSLLAMPIFAQKPTQREADTGTNQQTPSYASAIRVDDAQHEGMSEADEAKALAKLATITPEQAKKAALAAHPGTSVVKVDLDNENGAVVYSVELNNGLDVKVDAGNGTVLHTDRPDAGENESGESGESDTDNAQED